jgi:ABC-type transporter Mla MlaB component
MPLKISQDSSIKGLCKLTIDDDMTIYSINEIKNGLNQEIDLYQQFDLDLSAVEEIDTAGIQLLLALRLELISKNKELKITSVSAVVAELMASYSLNSLFNRGEMV